MADPINERNEWVQFGAFTIHYDDDAQVLSVSVRPMRRLAIRPTSDRSVLLIPEVSDV